MNGLLIQTSLRKYTSDFQIWIFHPNEQKWFLIDIFKQPISTPLLSLNHLQFSEGRFLCLDYPQEYKIAIISLDAIVNYEKRDIEILYHLLYPLYSHFALKSKNIELKKLIEGIKNITASLDINDLLSNILDNVASVVPGANTSAFWQYNPALDRLVCKAYRGWKPDIEKVQYQIGESVTGKTYRDGKHRIYYSFRRANEAMKGTSLINAQLLKRAFHGGRVKAAVTVPVKFHDEIRGVLSIHQDSRARKLAKWDIQLINALAAQIAIAIENARLFTEIKRKNQVLVKRNDVHISLTKLSIQNKGVNAITMELNRMIKPSISFVDLLEEEFYAKDQLNHFTYEELYKLIGNRNSPIHLQLFDNGIKNFVLFPTFVGNVCAGCLIVDVKLSLTQLEYMILERGNVFLSLELAKRHAITEVHYKKMHDFYHQLLTSDHPDLLYKQGLDYGIDLKKYVISIIVEFSQFHDLQTLETKVHHFVWTIKQTFIETSKLVFGHHNKITLLLSIDSPNDLSAIMKSVESIINQWQQSEQLKLYAGVGRLYNGILSIAKTHNEAERALSYLLSKQQVGMIQYAEMGINRLFLNHHPEELQQFTDEVLSPLLSYSQDLEETLLVYMHNNRSAAKTAASLHIHINTLYQRIKKIEEILEISFDDPDMVLKIQLACYLKEA